VKITGIERKQQEAKRGEEDGFSKWRKNHLVTEEQQATSSFRANRKTTRNQAKTAENTGEKCFSAKLRMGRTWKSRGVSFKNGGKFRPPEVNIQRKRRGQSPSPCPSCPS
jgi:hypothetical protein